MSTTITQPIEVAAPHTDEWYAARSTGIGASEAAAAAGLSEWCTPYELYLRKTGEIGEVEDNDAMRRGRALEPIVISEYCHATGRTVKQSPVPMMRSAEHPFVLATLDAILDPIETEDEALEVKNTNWRMRPKWGPAETDEVPTEFVCQVQQQLKVSGLNVGRLAVWFDASDLRTYTIHRNERLIELLIAAEAELWERIQDRKPPEPNFEHKSTPELIKEVHESINDKRVHLSAQANQWWERRNKCKRLMKELDKRAKQLESRVYHEIGDNFAGVLEGEDKMIRRKLIKGGPVSYVRDDRIDYREVNYDGVSVEEDAVDVIPAVAIQKRYEYADGLLRQAGFELRTESQWGSRYYIKGGIQVRVSDHPPNFKTNEWMLRQNVHGIRVDDPNVDVAEAVERLVSQ